MWTPDREYVPVLDKVHWWVGRLLFLIGIVNVAFGLQVYIDKFDEGNGGLMIGFWTVLVVGILAMIYGQWKFGQINHVAGRHGYKH